MQCTVAVISFEQQQTTPYYYFKPSTLGVEDLEQIGDLEVISKQVKVPPSKIRSL